MNKDSLELEYNKKVAALRQDTNMKISIIQSLKISRQFKAIQITTLNTILQRQINILYVKLQTDIKRLPPSIPPGNNKALLIGCNYKNTPYELKGCLNDVCDIQQLLKISYNYTDNSILIMTDNQETIEKLPPSINTLKPTRQNIIRELTNILKTTNTGDSLIITYSGHGINITDGNKDEKDGLDECIVTSELNYISDDELYTILQKNQKPNTTIIMLSDSCHSGTMLDLKYNYLISDNKSAEPQSTVNETYGQVILISGCCDAQTSADAVINNKPRGAMTWALLETLKQSPNITWKDLILNMRKLLQQIGCDQLPQLSSGRPLNIDTLATFATF